MTARRVAAVLAFAVGAMSVVAGGRAAQGWDPGYAVLAWLPIYNFALGVWTVAVPAPLIWRGSRRALPATLATLAAHGVVLLLLAFSALGTPATQSLLAMTFRISVWLVILVLVRRGSAVRGSSTTGGNGRPA